MTDTTDETVSNKLLFRLTDVARICSRGRTSLYSDIAAGRLRVAKVGRTTLVSRDALIAYAELLASGDASEQRS
jgi:hypothetical protein